MVAVPNFQVWEGVSAFSSMATGMVRGQGLNCVLTVRHKNEQTDGGRC